MTKLFNRLMAAAAAAIAAPTVALADSPTWGQSDYAKPWAAFRKQAPVVMKRKEIRAVLQQAFPTLNKRQITTLLRSYVLEVLASVNDKGIPSLETFINRRRPRGQSTGATTRTVGGNHDGTASSRADRIAWGADTVHLRSSATPPSSCLTATCTYSWEDDSNLPNPHQNRAHSGVASRRDHRDINGQMREIPLDPAILAPFKGSVYYYGRAASNWPTSINTDGTWEGSTAMNAALKIDFDTLELTGGLYSTVSGGPTFDLSKVHLLNDRQLSGSCSCSGGWGAVQRPDGLWVRNSKTVFEGDYTPQDCLRRRRPEGGHSGAVPRPTVRGLRDSQPGAHHHALQSGRPQLQREEQRCTRRHQHPGTFLRSSEQVAEFLEWPHRLLGPSAVDPHPSTPSIPYGSLLTQTEHLQG